MKVIQKISLIITALCLVLLTTSFSISAQTNSEDNTLTETTLYSGSMKVDTPWAVATSTHTTNTDGGKLDPYIITKGGYFRIEYTGEEGNLSLAISNWTTSQWATVAPSRSGKTETGFYSDFTFEDCAAAYKSEDFSDISAICTCNGSDSVTINKLSWYGYPIKNDLGADAMLFRGSKSTNVKNTNLTYFFTKHVGGDWDASKINKDSYFYVEYKGAEDGIFLALTSTSGAPKWVAVYPDKTVKKDSNLYYSIYNYDNFSKAFGTNFARLDQIQVYSNKDADVTLKRIAYFSGNGDPVDTSDGTWDRPDTGIAFLGDSIIQNAMYLYNDFNTILGRTDCSNYGIACQTSVDCEKRIDEIAKKNYSKVVMLCGINDIGHGVETADTIASYKSMFKKINDKNPNTKIYIISVLPTTPVFFENEQYKITDLNKELKSLSEQYDYVTFVDCYSSFVGDDGYCISEYSADGIHPNEKGYSVIAKVLNPYLNDEINTDTNNTENTETELYTGNTEVKTPWSPATTTYTTNVNYPDVSGTFNPSQIDKDGYFRVYYTGEEGKLYLAFNSWINPKWARVDPTNSGKNETGYYSDFSFTDCANAYGEDFSDVSTISLFTSDTSSPMSITKLSWISTK